MMVDENYHFREPSMVPLEEGLEPRAGKEPQQQFRASVDVHIRSVLVNPKTPGCNVKEYPGLKFSTRPEWKIP
ncbi:MAG: hypothetical protein ACLSUW_06155 [Akkermansia sp.]